MAIYKRGEKWWFEVYRPGKKLLRGSCGTNNEDDARAVERVMRAAFSKKTDAQKLHRMIDAVLGEEAPVGLPVGQEWAEYGRWLITSNARLAKTTLDARQQACERFDAWAVESYPAAGSVERVDRACAAAFAEKLSKEKLKSKTRKNVITNLQAVWEGLRRLRDGIVNPWPLVVPAVDDGERGEPFTREHEKAVIAAADKAGFGWGIACRIARATGLRYGDVATLKWGDVDLKGRWIALKPSKTARHGIRVRVPLSSELAARLTAYRPNGAKDGDWVLPVQGPIYPWQYKPCKFSAVLAAARLSGYPYTFHSWRHTFRTRLSEAGVSDDIAKRLGGWREETTADLYDHAERVDDLRKAIEAGSAVKTERCGRRA